MVGLDHVNDRSALEEDVIDRALEGCLVDAQARRGIALRIEIDQEGAPLGQSEAGREVDRSRGLSDSALLIHNGQRFDPLSSPTVVPRGTSPSVFHVEHYPGAEVEFNFL